MGDAIGRKAPREIPAPGMAVAGTTCSAAIDSAAATGKTIRLNIVWKLPNSALLSSTIREKHFFNADETGVDRVNKIVKIILFLTCVPRWA